MCTINENHMMYGYWDMEWDKQDFLSFWVIFCPFTPVTAQKIKVSKKWKTCLEIPLFYNCVPKIIIRWYAVPEIWCTMDGQTDERKKWLIEVGAPPENTWPCDVCNCMLQIKPENNVEYLFRAVWSKTKLGLK